MERQRPVGDAIEVLRARPLAEGESCGWELAAGSVPGRRHLGQGGLLVGRPSQDAFACCDAPGGIVAAVCDGCSGGAQSEVGAALGARWAVVAARAELLEGPGRGAPGAGWEAAGGGARPSALEEALERVRRRVLGRLRLLLRTLWGDPGRALAECGLFTVILAAATRQRVVVAAIGDGVVLVDGAPTRLGPFPGNAPPYLGYGLLDRPPAGFGPGDLRFRVVCDRPAGEVRSLLIGTDGVEDLVRAADAGARLPGRSEPLGDLRALFAEDRLFANPDALRRWLALANSEAVRWDPAAGRLERSPGLLPDDTTLVLLRRGGAEGGPAARREESP